MFFINFPTLVSGTIKLKIDVNKTIVLILIIQSFIINHTNAFAEIIIKSIVINNINPTEIKTTDKYDKDLDVVSQKLVILLSVNGCIIAHTNFNNKENIKICKIGEIIV